MLSNKCGFQLQYQMIFCVWLLAFSPQLCEQLRRYNVVPALSDILQESVKEKVTRIILAAFRVCAEFLKYFFSVVTLNSRLADCSCLSFFFPYEWFWTVICILLNHPHNFLHLLFDFFTKITYKTSYKADEPIKPLSKYGFLSETLSWYSGLCQPR